MRATQPLRWWAPEADGPLPSCAGDGVGCSCERGAWSVPLATDAMRHAMTSSVMSAALLLLCSSVALAQTEAPTLSDLQDTDGDPPPPEGASALDCVAADDVNGATSAGPLPNWLDCPLILLHVNHVLYMQATLLVWWASTPPRRRVQPYRA